MSRERKVRGSKDPDEQRAGRSSSAEGPPQGGAWRPNTSPRALPGGAPGLRAPPAPQEPPPAPQPHPGGASASPRLPLPVSPPALGCRPRPFPLPGSLSALHVEGARHVFTSPAATRCTGPRSRADGRTSGRSHSPYRPEPSERRGSVRTRKSATKVPAGLAPLWGEGHLKLAGNMDEKQGYFRLIGSEPNWGALGVCSTPHTPPCFWRW